MSSKGSGGAPPKYLNDFSKALAGEVRILLQEVGKLRDERRALQYEIAELMALKSKHGAGGEYTPDWKPTHDEPAPPPSPGPPPPPASVVGDAPARPAWRVVNKREERRQKAKAKALPPPEPIPQPEPTRAPNLPAWAQWRPDPLFSPQPHPGTPGQPLAEPIPSRSGLFGPPTPPPK